MFDEPDKILKNCPKEIEEELKDIVDLSEDFLEEVDVVPTQYIDEIKVDLQEAKNYLFQIISRFVTLINENFKEGKDLVSVGLKLKFEEDVGAIMGDLKKKPFDRIEGSIGITSLLKFSGELKTTYDFLIYNPLIMVNKKKFEDIETDFKDIFKIIRTNASMLGYEEKLRIPISKKILPKPGDMIIGSKGGKIGEKPDIDLSGLTGEQEGGEDV